MRRVCKQKEKEVQRSRGRKEVGVLNSVKGKLAVGSRQSHRVVGQGKWPKMKLGR